jgi:TetR/AcrR family transcriptional regulator
MSRPLRLAVARRPGRPRGGDDPEVRDALLEAARTLFLRHGFRAVSSRQIAAAARVNPAMIHYYFDGKDGLYRAMLEAAIAPVLTRLVAMLGQQESVDIEALAHGYMKVLAANPWIPGLMVREVFSPDGSFRQVFIRDFAGRFAPMLRTVIGREIDVGHLRDDLDPSLTCISLMSLAVFPFISMPITTRVLGLETSEAGIEKLITHTLGVFLRGVARKETAHA